VSAAGDVARMLTLVPWLLERPGASLTETAEQFGVDERTIRRDLGHLDFCGLPGLGGGDLFEVELVGDRIVVRMADELRRPLRPTPREALRLVLTVDAVAEALGDELPALRSAVAKVRDALGIPEVVADVLEPSEGASSATAAAPWPPGGGSCSPTRAGRTTRRNGGSSTRGPSTWWTAPGTCRGTTTGWGSCGPSGSTVWPPSR
jgi:hypothetical protein